MQTHALLHSFQKGEVMQRIFLELPQFGRSINAYFMLHMKNKSLDSEQHMVVWQMQTSKQQIQKGKYEK